jgi:hypothetical protein
MAVLLTILRRAGVAEDRLSSTLIRYTDLYEVDAVEVEARERPPMLTVAAYRAKFGRELTA